VKKILVLTTTLIITAIVGLACGGGSAEDPTAAPTATQAPAPTATQAPAPTATQVTESDSTSATNAGSVKLIVGSAASDDLVFDSESMTAQTGSQVELVFNNNAVTQQHNWVLVQDGTKDQVSTAGLVAGQDNNWVDPNDANVVANAPLLAAGESASVSFVAPAAGTYQFVCTFPGHNMTMFGTFEVTP